RCGLAAFAAFFLHTFMTKAYVKKDVPVRKTAASAPKAEISQTEDSSGPVWKMQRNRVQGAMWRHNQSGNRVRYTVSISRSYKDKETDKWMSVHYFDQKDLPDVAA